MKTKLLITLSILSLSLFSQNWSLINSNYTYNYAVDEVYELSIYAESISLNGSDTTFFINKIVVNCDTCSGEGYGALLRNQPTFFQKEVTKKVNKYIFSDSLSFSILSHAESNDTWIFDTLNNINAEVVSKTYESVFGISDSIKYIRLSNNDSIIISKNYGIIRFDVPDTSSYLLIGIEKPTENLGYIVPKFHDFFNFNIGDVYQYRNQQCCSNGGGNWEYRIKYTILSKEVNGDTIKYIRQKDFAGYSVFHCSWFSPIDSFYNYTTDTVIFIDSVLHFTNNLNYELYSELFPVPYVSSDDTIYYESTEVSIENGITTKQFRINPTGIEPYYFYLPENPDILLIDENRIKKIYKTGLGLTYQHFGWFEADSFEELIGYVKNGDTTGIVYGDDVYLQTKEIKGLGNEFIIYPNPAKEYITVKFNNTERKQISDIFIYNVSGKIVKRISVNKNAVKINTNTLKSGVYFVNIITKDGISQRRKLIIL